jgi:hypothetical protein
LGPARRRRWCANPLSCPGRAKLRATFDEAAFHAAGNLRVLNTYSGHRSLSNHARERLFHGIADLIVQHYGGSITEGYLTTLYVAHRR